MKRTIERKLTQKDFSKKAIKIINHFLKSKSIYSIDIDNEVEDVFDGESYYPTGAGTLKIKFRSKEYARNKKSNL